MQKGDKRNSKTKGRMTMKIAMDYTIVSYDISGK